MTKQEKANIRASCALCKNYIEFKVYCVKNGTDFWTVITEKLTKLTGQKTFLEWKVYALRNKLNFVKLLEKAMS